jgi:putative acetyltransferase
MSEMEDGTVLRPASNADTPAVRELVFAVLREFGLTPDPAQTDADLTDLKASYLSRGGRFDLLIGPDGKLLGTVGLYPVDRETVELRKMYLRPEARGHGYGRRLLDHALAEGRKMGFRRMTLETASVLRDAIAMYTRYGFRPFVAEHRSKRCDQTYVLEL